MKHLAIRRLAAAFCAAACVVAPALAQKQKPAPAQAVTVQSAPGGDQRNEISLNPGEREMLLAGMRIYLRSVQGIVEALAANNLKGVGESAARSGNKMLQEVSPVTAWKLPLGFTTMSLATHEQFDALARRAARSPSRSEVLSDLDAILANCTSCHETYRVSRAR